MSFQRFFRLFRRLAGLTGTAAEAAAELWHIYRLAVIAIPTHRADIRRLYPSRVYATRSAKWDAVASDVARLHAAGQPVLVGTRTVEASEELSSLLTEHGITHRVLNAIRHQEEAEVIAMAGAPGQVTIATNMAGCGTDIKVDPPALEKGGLHVLVTEMHTSARIDRQLVGRTGRQGDPGSARLYVSVEDELFQRFLPAPIHQQVAEAVRWKLPGNRLLALAAARRAQRSAQRLSSRQRRSILQMDTWLDEHLAFAQRDQM